MRQLKNRVSRVFAEYFKNGSTDFHQTCHFRQSSIEIIERLKTGHSLLPW